MVDARGYSDDCPVPFKLYKRRRTRSHENISATSSCLCSFVLKSSEQNPHDVDVILKNFNDFASLASEYKCQLSVNCENPNNVVVSLRSSDSTTRYTNEMMEKFESLVQRKKNEKNSLESRLEELTRSFQASQISVEQRLSSLEANDRVHETVTKNVKKLLRNEEKRHDITEEMFFNQTNFELLRECPYILDRICMEMCGDNEEPFSLVSTTFMRRKILLTIFDLLQTDYSVEVDGNYLSRTARAVIDSNVLMYGYGYVSDMEYDEEKRKMNEKFQLVDVVGTVHAMVFGPREPEGNLVFLVLVIVDKRIICLFTGEQNEPPVEGLRNFEILYNQMKQNVSIGDTARKYAVLCPLNVIPEDFSDLLVAANNEEVFKENSKVCTFIHRNFHCTKSFRFEAIVPFYNICYECF